MCHLIYSEKTLVNSGLSPFELEKQKVIVTHAWFMLHEEAGWGQVALDTGVPG